MVYASGLATDEPRRCRIDIDRGILLCPEHPAIRYHNKLPAMRGFIPDVCQTISPIDFLCAQLFRWEVCGSPIAYPVNFDPDGVRRLSKISLSNVKSECCFIFTSLFFSLTTDLQGKNRYVYPFVLFFFIGFFCNWVFYNVIFYENVSK